MKVKNIMFSGFAAAILMGVGAANAVVANPVTLADQGYVDAKVKVVADEVATKEAEANKFTDATAKSWMNAENKDVQFPTINVAERIALDSIAGISADIEDLTDIREKANNATTDIATLKGNAETAGSVAHSIAAALKTAEDDATAKADQALADAKADTTAQINALKLSETYEEKGAAAAALTAAQTYAEGQAADALADAKVYADGLATNYDEAGAAAKALTDAKTYTNEQVAIVDGKVTDNANAITTLTGDGDGSVKKMAADAATAAVNASGHATEEALQAEIDRAKAAEKVNADAITALQDGKLDVVKSAGTYMVTRDAEGNVSYTKVRVATVGDNGNTTVTE